MPKTTRVAAIQRHLVNGGFTYLGLTLAAQEQGPNVSEGEGFALRQHTDEAGTLVVVAGAYGPYWLRTMAEIVGRLEQRHVRCVVIAEAPGVADHEVMVRWATAAELRAREAVQEARQAPVTALLRRQEAEQRAEEQRRELEEAGQCGLF